MAEQIINSVTLAVTGELTSRVFSRLIQRYGKDAATSEKLQRLELLLIKIHSSIEASEKRTIENSWLLQWCDKLKEATLQGDVVLATFLQRAKDAQAASSTVANQQQGEAASSSNAASATVVGKLSFTRNSLSGMVQGICNARKMLFPSSDDDRERLDKTLERLEVLSSDIGEFIRLLHFEALPNVDQTPCSTTLSGPFSFLEPPPEEEEMDRGVALCLVEAHSLPSQRDTMVLPEERQFIILQDRLEVEDKLDAAFDEICKAVKLADSHALEDLEWLAYWASILREAKEQGRDVLGTTITCKTVNTENDEEWAVKCDQEQDELGTILFRLDGLARDVEYFSKLVYLCPAR